MSEIRNYRDLLVWQKSVDWVTHIYGLSRSLPSAEKFALTDQLHRAAVSVPANIAEGHGRAGVSDYPKFLRYALGSLNETETHIEVAIRLDYLNRADCGGVVSESEEIRRMFTTHIRRLEEKNR